MTRPALKLAPAALSPERQALADRIAEAAPKRATADEARARAEAARGALALAQEAVPAAERAAETAKAFLVENPHAPRADLRAKRRAVADAADDLAIAREVSARLDAAEAEAERSARYAAEAVGRAADAVLVGAYEATIEAAERAGREFARLAFAAHVVAQSGDPWDGERDRLTRRADTLNPGHALRCDWANVEAVRGEAEAPWHAARATLMLDPSAPVPAP